MAVKTKRENAAVAYNTTRPNTYSQSKTMQKKKKDLLFGAFFDNRKVSLADLLANLVLNAQLRWLSYRLAAYKH